MNEQSKELPVFKMEPPPNCTPEQIQWWNENSRPYNVIGHARHRLALLRPEWRTGQGYKRLSHDFTLDLDDNPKLAESLLNDEVKLLTYAAALRLRGL